MMYNIWAVYGTDTWDIQTHGFSQSKKEVKQIAEIGAMTYVWPLRTSLMLLFVVCLRVITFVNIIIQISVFPSLQC